MAKRRFNLDENFDDVVSFIEKPKDVPAPEAAQLPKSEEAVTVASDKKIEKLSSNEPNKIFRRNITLSEEVFWRLNYIKDRKNKNRTAGDKFTTIDGLMQEMIQQCLDSQYASTLKKFEEYKNDEMEEWV